MGKETKKLENGKWQMANDKKREERGVRLSQPSLETIPACSWVPPPPLSPPRGWLSLVCMAHVQKPQVSPGKDKKKGQGRTEDGEGERRSQAADDVVRPASMETKKKRSYNR